MTRLLVYESKPVNAAMLARLARVELVEVRSVLQLEQAISEASDGFAMAVEVTQQALIPVARLVRRAKTSQATAVIAMPDKSLQCGTRILYEAGADLLFRSMLDRDMARSLLNNVLRAHANRRQASASVPFRAQVWESLPWKRHATGG